MGGLPEAMQGNAGKVRLFFWTLPALGVRAETSSAI